MTPCLTVLTPKALRETLEFLAKKLEEDGAKHKQHYAFTIDPSELQEGKVHIEIIHLTAEATDDFEVKKQEAQSKDRVNDLFIPGNN